MVLDEFTLIAGAIENAGGRALPPINELEAKRMSILADTIRPQYARSIALMDAAINPAIVFVDGLLHSMAQAERKDYVMVTGLMISKHRASDLKDYLDDCRQTLLTLPVWDDEDYSYFSEHISISTQYDKKNAEMQGKRTWEQYHFDHVPAVAAHTLLLKFKGDLLNSRNLALERMYEKLMAETDTSGNSN